MNTHSTRLRMLPLASLFVLLVPVTVASAGSQSVSVLRPTKVVVQCKPEAVNPGKTTECLVTVSDNGAGKKVAPVGTVTVTTNGPGSFDATSCTLAPAVTASRCSVRYTPARIGSGAHTITASYSGSDVHAASTKAVAVGVTPPNDDVRAAQQLGPPPSAADGTLVGATYSYSDPDAECADLEGTVWYRFTARKSQRVAIRLQAHGKLDAALAVFQPVRSKYRALGCAPTDEKGLAGMAFDVVKRGQYLILVGALEDSARSTFRLELFAPPAAHPPGTALPIRGARSTLDPLTRPEEAWWAALAPGRTYRINLAAERGRCVSLSLYAPGTKSFADATALRRARCGGYLVFTPGPDGGGRYSFLVEAEGGRGGAQHYRLGTALAGVDDTAPGITVMNREKRHGSISGRGVDVVDLYRFEVSHVSDVTLRYQGSKRLLFDVVLLSSTGAGIDYARGETGGGKLRTHLEEGEYYVAFRAGGQTAGSYTFTLLIREITTTTVTINGLEEATTTPGEWVTLGALVTPSAAIGGPIRLQVDRFDPIEGWQFFRLVNARVGSGGRASVSWKPPSLGRWRLHAVFLGSTGASPSKSGYAYLDVRSH
jgi:Bacterial Ig-like domain (group 3)